ncbi:MAG: hypothetical protein JWQ36_2125 [Enterovirga sp.]|nr:hypothetical protein [Enterovirga sp.]
MAGGTGELNERARSTYPFCSRVASRLGSPRGNRHLQPDNGADAGGVAGFRLPRTRRKRRTRRPSPARGLVSWRCKEQARGVGRRTARSFFVWRAFRRPRDASRPSSPGLTRGPRRRCTASGFPRHGRRFCTGPAARQPSRPCGRKDLSHAALAPGPYYPEGGAGPASRVRGSRNPHPQAPHPLPLSTTPRESAPRRRGYALYTAYIPMMSSGVWPRTRRENAESSPASPRIRPRHPRRPRARDGGAACE